MALAVKRLSAWVSIADEIAIFGLNRNLKNVGRCDGEVVMLRVDNHRVSVSSHIYHFNVVVQGFPDSFFDNFGIFNFGIPNLKF